MDTETEIITELESQSEILLHSVKQTKEELEEYYPILLKDATLEEEANQKARSLKRAGANLTRAQLMTYTFSDELSSRINDLHHQRKKKRLIASAPANAAIDYTETVSDHFARGRNIYKMLLLCFIGSFIGVVIELIWCLLRNGYFESRSGLVWGPFNLLYGAGAVCLTFCLYPMRNHSAWISFGGGFVVGSILEYACSFGQEMLFGSTSWDYSAQPFNINGRICLLYSVFWGILGVLWIKDIYPRMARLILKIPDKAGRIATWILTVFFVLNSCMSLAAVARWSERVNGEPAENAVEEWIDRRFPDERMEKIYANMDFSSSSEEK